MRIAALLCLALVLLAAACADAETPACPEGTDPFVEYRLFMGRSNDTGEVVDDAAWAAFLEDTVTPLFPDGLTVLDARGQWRGADGVILKERSKALIVLAPPGEDKMLLTREISEEYKRRFGQEAVLRVVEDVCVTFS